MLIFGWLKPCRFQINYIYSGQQRKAATYSKKIRKGRVALASQFPPFNTSNQIPSLILLLLVEKSKENKTTATTTTTATTAMIKASLLLFSLFLLHAPISYSHPNPLSHAHAQLTNYGFPIGLLPTSVKAYSLNQTSGHFSVHLGDSCKLTLPPDNYVAAYSRVITGKIYQGRIADLDGIRVRAFFNWWSITGIRSSDDNLVFEVGMVTAKFPSKNFDESPHCEGQKSSS